MKWLMILLIPFQSLAAIETMDILTPKHGEWVINVYTDKGRKFVYKTKAPKTEEQRQDIVRKLKKELRNK